MLLHKRHFNRNVLLSSLMSLFTTFIVSIYMWGFAIPYNVLVKSLGVYWFILFLPQMLPSPKRWWQTHSLQSIYLLLSMATLGFLKRYVEWIGILSEVTVWTGLALGILGLIKYLKNLQGSYKELAGYVFLAFLISSYFLAQIYKFGFSPILAENFSVLNLP